jgi:hypothetical protein
VQTRNNGGARIDKAILNERVEVHTRDEPKGIRGKTDRLEAIEE